MRQFEEPVIVGLRDRESDKLKAVYPQAVKGDFKEIEDKVRYWYYQQNCSAGEEMRNYYLDTLTDAELKMHNNEVRQS